MTSHAVPTDGDAGMVRLPWDRHDHHRLVTVIALLGFLATAAIGAGAFRLSTFTARCTRAASWTPCVADPSSAVHHRRALRRRVAIQPTRHPHGHLRDCRHGTHIGRVYQAAMAERDHCLDIPPTDLRHRRRNPPGPARNPAAGPGRPPPCREPSPSDPGGRRGLRGRTGPLAEPVSTAVNPLGLIPPARLWS